MRFLKEISQSLWVSICLVVIAVPAQAWEFQLSGSSFYVYKWYTQLGSSGFFGPYDVDTGTGTPGAANLNFWNGYQFDTCITSAGDANWLYYNVSWLPQIKINESLRINGKYRQGKYRRPTSSYRIQDAPGTDRAMGEGRWTMLWVTAATPWGVLEIGKRRWSFGTGLQYDGIDDASNESISLTSALGPFNLGIGIYPYRFAGKSSIPAYAWSDLYNDNPKHAPEYFSRADRSGSFSTDLLFYATYQGGSTRAGILGSYGSYHIGPEAELKHPPLSSASIVPKDVELFHGTTFLMFNNGRFFFNAELAWLYWTDRWSGTPTNAAPNPQYIEQWRYVLELGAYRGRTKVSLLHAWTPGPDRRGTANGTLDFIGKQPAAFVRHAHFDRTLGSYYLFRSYSYLFAYNYGAGLNAYNLSDDGYVRDACIWAARVDHALAANLNVSLSFSHARRTSNGYSWGCIGPNAGVPSSSFSESANGDVNYNFNRYENSPNIPETRLGYEVDVACQWKLMEKWVLGIIAGYWQPGRWFSYACIDRSVEGWPLGTAANNFGTRPGRRIDPIVGSTVTFSFEF